MYEGKNIHYSPLDNKPLCSYSGKVCKQRRLNGYALCLRHVLEDPDAPFRQCAYRARNKQQCTNPIHQTNASEYCTSHMQLMGLLPLSTIRTGSKSSKVLLSDQQTSNHSKNEKMSISSDVRCGVLPLENSSIDTHIINMIGPMSEVRQIKESLPGSEVNAASLANLYPELAEKLEKSDINKSTVWSKTDSSLSTDRLDSALSMNVFNGCDHASGFIKHNQSDGCGRSKNDVHTYPARSNQLSATDGRQTYISIMPQQDCLQITGNTLPIKCESHVESPLIGLPWQLPSSRNQSLDTVHDADDHLPNSIKGCHSSVVTETSSSNSNHQSACHKSVFPNTVACISSRVYASNSFDTSQPDVNAQRGVCSRDSCCNNKLAMAKPVLTSSVDKSGSLSRMQEDSAEWKPVAPYMVKPKTRHCVEWCGETCSSVKIGKRCLLQIRHSPDILPFGVDSTDDDNDECYCELPRQHHWFSLSSDDEDRDTDVADDIASSIRRTKLLLYKSKERRQFMQLQSRHTGNGYLRHERSTIDLELVSAARKCPVAAVRSIKAVENSKRRLKLSVRSPTRVNSCCDDVQMERKQRHCLFKTDDDLRCTRVSLPYANHCIQHIMYNVEQQLFSYCTAKCADSTQCCQPVFDVEHELPLCYQHSSYQAHIRENCYESASKKQRKKTKPSALTRPPKKGKKKKQKQTRYTIIGSAVRHTEFNDADLSAGDRNADVLHGNVVGSDVVAVDSNPLDEDDSFDLVDSLSPGAVERNLSLGLPIDTDQATKFLDEHDLHDVLNKMPDEAFDLLTGKNGVYGISRDDDDAVSSVLSDVTKSYGSVSLDTRFTMAEHHQLMPSKVQEEPMSMLPEDELMKQLTVLFDPATMDQLSDGIADFTSGNIPELTPAVSAVWSSPVRQQNHVDGKLPSQSSTLCDRSLTPAISCSSVQLANGLNSRNSLISMACVQPVIQPSSIQATSRPAVSSRQLFSLLPTSATALSHSLPLFINRCQITSSLMPPTNCVRPATCSSVQQLLSQLTASSFSPSAPSTYTAGISTIGHGQYSQLNHLSTPVTSGHAFLSKNATPPVTKQSCLRYIIDSQPKMTVATSLPAAVLPLTTFSPFAPAVCQLPVSTSKNQTPCAVKLEQTLQVNHQTGGVCNSNLPVLSVLTEPAISATNSYLSSNVVEYSTEQTSVNCLSVTASVSSRASVNI